MHELSMTRELVNLINKSAADRTPKRAVVLIGALTTYVPESIYMYYKKLRRPGMPDLDIRLIEAMVSCRECGHTGEPMDNIFICCERCQSTDVEVKAGNELELSELIYDVR